MIVAVFGNAYQLALIIEETFDNHLRLVGVCPFKGNVQVFANTFDGDVFRSKTVLTFSQNIFAVGYGFDNYRLALRVRSELSC